MPPKSSTPATTFSNSSALAALPSNPSAPGGRNPRAAEANQGARRQQVAAACKSCQVRKAKCDGQRPCAWCRDREKPCEYDVLAGETRMRANKRKYEDIEQEHQQLLELVDIAALRPDARDILQQLKRGRKVVDLLGLLKEGDVTYQTHIGSNPRTRRMLLSLLIQSTASLDEIILLAPRIAEARLDIAWELDDGDTQALRNRTIDAKAIISAVEGGSAREVPLAAVDPPRELGGDMYLGKRRLISNGFSVPAQPWTKLTTDDDFVSHLVTIFLNYCNLYWRYVEEDLFLQSMQGSISTEFCSPFLVNAVCALACLDSEHSTAFLRPEDLISRGQHFHDEALRLWLMEDGKASVTNIQALVISAVSSSFRGKDKLGVSLLAVAIQMNKDLAFPPESPEAITMSDRTRARVSASWTAHLYDTVLSLALLRPCVQIDTRLQFLPNLPESRRFWTGEPFLCTNTYLRPNALMRERCQLARLSAEVTNLLFSSTDNISGSAAEKAATGNAARALMERMEGWYSLLPNDFQLHKNLAAPLYELHGHYYSALMTLRSSVDAFRSFPASPGTTSPTSLHQQVPLLLTTVLEAANVLGHFRQTCGFKTSPSCIVLSAAMVSSILLNFLGASSTGSVLAEGTSYLGERVEMAFGESYRCLLAFGTRTLGGRGIARMVYHTSRTSKIALPKTTRRLLEIVDEVVWTSTDARHISSNLPNWAIAQSPGNSEARMGSMLKQWENLGLEDITETEAA